jgi:phage recombination protein Bet
VKPSDEKLLRNTLTANLTEDEHALFVLACDRSELDPFARQIYFAKDGGKLVIQATIDGLRLSAERTKQYTGQLGPEWCGTDGIWKEIWTETTPPTAARVGIRRADFADPIWGKALYSEFVQDSEFWRGMPVNQLAKCAEALGFRKAFPQQFSGLYTPEEMEKAEAKSLRVVSAQARNDRAPLAGSKLPLEMPVRGDVDLRPIPAPLQPFIEPGGAIPYKNQTAGFEFIRAELQDKLGHEEGTRVFNSIRFRLPRVFPTKEACQAATLRAWLEMWSFVEQGREAA